MASRNRLASEEEIEGVNMLAQPARISPGTQYGAAPMGASVAGLAAPAANAPIAGMQAGGVLMEDLARLATDRFADQFAALGWSGPTMVPTGRMVEQYIGGDNPVMVEEMAVSPEFAKFVQDKGISTSLNDMGFGTSDITLTQNGKPLETYSSRLTGFEKAMEPVMNYGVPAFLSYLTGQAIGGLTGGLGDLSSLPGSGSTNALASSLNPADILASPLPELAAAPLPAVSTIAPSLAPLDLASMAGSGAGNALANMVSPATMPPLLPELAAAPLPSVPTIAPGLGTTADLASMAGSGSTNALANMVSPNVMPPLLPEVAAAPLPATSTIAPSLAPSTIPSTLSAADILATPLPEVAAAPLPTPATLAPELAAPVVAPPRLTPAAMEAGIGTPGYGTNAAAVEAGLTPSPGFAGMSPTDFGMSGAQTAAYDAAIAAGAAPEAALAASNAAPVLGSPAATAATTAAATGASAVTNPYQFLIPAASNIVGAVIGAQATKSATDASNAAANRAAELQYQAQKEALDLQKRMYEENVARQQPYYQTGVNALSQMAGRTGAMPPAFQFRPEQLTTDPGYGFRLSEGLKALERSAAARGGLLSGGTGKALTRFGQEMGSQEFGNAYNRALTEYNALRQREGEEYNRLAGLAGVGGTTAQQLGQAGQAYGQQTGNLLTGTAANVGNLLTQQGQNMANAAIARGSLYGRGLSDIGYLAGQYYGRPPGP